MAVQPIRPSQVVKKKHETLPDAVLESFNELIVKNYQDGYCCFKQNEIVALIASRMDVNRQEVFDKHWLDVEAIYEKAGWEVEYDKPGFNESYEATFSFRKKR